ncbi:MAG: helix-turn-helix transcriptional regulator [Acidobacteriota bacterium]
MSFDANPHLPVKPVDFHVLLALAGEELHGYGLVQRIEEQSEGKVRLVPSNLYAVLRRLESRGLVARSDRRPVPDLEDQRRRYFRLTTLGLRVLRAEAERLRRLLLRGAEDRLLERPEMDRGTGGST